MDSFMDLGPERKLDFLVQETGMSTSRSINVSDKTIRQTVKSPTSKNPLSLSKRNTVAGAPTMKMEKYKSIKQLKKEEKYAQKLKDFKQEVLQGIEDMLEDIDSVFIEISR